MVSCGVWVTATVAVGDDATVVGVSDGIAGVGVSGVAVKVSGVGDAAVDVIAGEGEGVIGVSVGNGVSEEIDVGIVNIGAPTSLQPRSGAAPTYPVIGLGGINSPLVAVYCVTPLSMAGESGRRMRPLKSSST